MAGARQVPRASLPSRNGCVQHASERRREHVFRRQQADDDERLVRKVEEVARMHEDRARARAGRARAASSRARRRHAHHRRPAAFDAQHLAGRNAGGRARARRPDSARTRAWIAARIGAAAPAAPAPRPAPACRPTGSCRRSARAPRARRRARRRAADHHPAQLELRQPDRLRQAAERERRARRRAAARSVTRRPARRADSRRTPRRRRAPSPVRGRTPTSALELAARHVRAGRIVRRHDEHARVRRPARCDSDAKSISQRP